MAFHRWVEGEGRDVVVIVSLNEKTLYNYNLGLPTAGFWGEVFNSDDYDSWVNPVAPGNGGRIEASSRPLHLFPASAAIVIPANAIVVLARDGAH